MSKRPRSESGDSIPELEEVLKNDSEDEDVEIYSRRRRTEDEKSRSRWDNPNDSDNDEEYAVEHSLIEAGTGARVEPFRITRSEHDQINEEEDINGTEAVPEQTEAWLEASENSQFDNQKAAKQAAIREAYWDLVEKGATGPDRPVESYLFSVLRTLQSQETPRKAMDRFLGIRGASSSRPAQKFSIKARRAAKDSASSSDGPVKDIESFNKLTEECDALVAQGIHSVLEETQEKLQSRLNHLRFEYRWKENRDSEVYGPFSFEQLHAWDSQGCFADHPIQVRYAQSSQRWRDFII